MLGTNNTNSSSSNLVYWEKQDIDQLCGVHCINSLLQGPFFNEIELASLARELDDKEKLLLTGQGNHNLAQQESNNVADDGNYSIQVLQAALKKMGDLFIESVDSQINKGQDLSSETGFICNSDHHWFSIRRVNQIWYNLNSTNKICPEIISDFYLSAFLMSVKENGYNIFVVRGQYPVAKKELFENPQKFQRWFTSEQVKQMQGEQKSKKGGLNIGGSDNDQLEQAIKESMDLYNKQQDQLDKKGNRNNDNDDEEDNDIEKEEEPKFKPFQGQGIAMQSTQIKETSIQDYFNQFTLNSEDPELLFVIKLSLQQKFEVRPQSGLVIQFRFPDGTKKDWTFDPAATIRELYDFVASKSTDGNEYQFILMQNYPKIEFINLDITLEAAGLTSSTALIVSKRA